MILQTRDIEILKFIAKFGYVNSLHISNMFGLSKPRTSQILQRLLKVEYIKKDNIFTNEPNIFTLLTAGAELIKSKRVKKITLQNLRHNLLLVDVYIAIKLKNPELEILSDRELRAGRGFGAKGHIPDMEIVTQEQNGRKNIAIELELSRKNIKRIKSIFFTLKRKYVETHYYCDTSVYSHIKKLVIGNENIKVFDYFKLEEAPQIAEIVKDIERNKTETIKQAHNNISKVERENKQLLRDISNLESKNERLKENIKHLKKVFNEVDFKKATFGNNYILTGDDLERLSILFKGV